MTFLELAKNLSPHGTPESLRQLADAMEYGYCAALRSCSWRLHGVDYLYEGANIRALDDVLLDIRKKGGPI